MRRLAMLVVACVGMINHSYRAAAATYTYDVGFDIGALSIAGTIVTSCDQNCVPLSASSPDPLVSWSFTASTGQTISSTDSGAEVSGSGLIATPTEIVFDPQTVGTMEFDGPAAILTFAGASVDTPSGIFFDVLPGNADIISVVYANNDQTGGNPPTHVTIATLDDPSPVPVPGALLLFGTGLGFLGFAIRRKRLKSEKNYCAIDSRPKEN